MRPKRTATVTDTASHATVSRKTQFTYRTTVWETYLLPASRKVTRRFTRSDDTDS